MKYLAFRGSNRLRCAAFEERSLLPISAACVVANGVRETLTSLIGARVAMQLLEPAIPSSAAWTAIVGRAKLYKIRGSLTDAAVVWRASEACALAAAIFGEAIARSAVERELSPLESDVIERVTKAIAANLGVVCGARESLGIERVPAIEGFVTYFELLLEAPVAARIGIALSREPSSEPRGALDISHLGRVRIAGTLVLDLEEMKAAAVSEMRVGSLVPIGLANFDRCALVMDGRRVVRGTGGISNGRFAMVVEATEVTS
jgi:hypothetical protein